MNDIYGRLVKDIVDNILFNKTATNTQKENKI